MSRFGGVTWSQISHHIPPLGDQVNINHEGCPAGTDTKRRLYIKNTTNAILAYCHHCNEHYVKPKNKRRLDVVQEELIAKHSTPTAPKDVRVPIDTVWNPVAWEQDAHTWVFKNGLEVTTLLKYSVGYSPSWHRVILPVKDGIGTVVLWQGRKLGDRGPKYVTEGSARDVVAYYKHDKINLSRYVVLTEDILSAMRVSQDSDADGLALLGTNISDAVVRYLQTVTYNAVVVWMDDDDAGREAAHKIHIRLKSIIPSPVHTFTRTREPKLQHASSLRSIIDGVRTAYP